jgi:hypothetical protein
MLIIAGRVLGLGLLALCFTVLPPSVAPLLAQEDCDGCADAPWGKVCCAGCCNDTGGPPPPECMRQGQDCHQKQATHCDFEDSCEVPLLAASAAGTLAMSDGPLTVMGATDQLLTRSCDGAVIGRIQTTATAARMERETAVMVL